MPIIDSLTKLLNAGILSSGMDNVLHEDAVCRSPRAVQIAQEKNPAPDSYLLKRVKYIFAP
jgi:hypothetical protein